MTARAHVALDPATEPDFEQAAPGALAAWQTTPLSPALRKGATAIVDPGLEPVPGDQGGADAAER